MAVFKDHDAQTGITTTVHYIEDANRVAIQKTYDAEPFLKAASEMRASTEGERWGDMRHVGYIPMAELATMLRQDGTIDKKRVVEFLKKNPAFATFSKVLK
jgi:hypothetical protein